MKKLLALTLSLLLVFAAIPMTIASAVEIETRLDSSQVGITWAQKVWSSSLSNGVAGDYETDGYTKKLTTTRSGQGMIMVQFPASVFNEANLLKIKIAMTAETKIETKSFTAFFYKQGQNAGFDQRNTANNSVHYKLGAYVTLNADTQRVFTITPENHPGVFENKLNVF
ncbi:MAG: hypothetical protein IJD90_04600, partial [Clostridia bacterium]|nr:hypothetical protein [Clostridia bacterium]